MKLIYEERKSLPRLAWCACISKDKSSITVSHGPWVETQPNFFCEGAWNGVFAEGRPDQATAFMGSGGIINDNDITFASPTHFLEKLYLIREKDKVFVANSLAYILAELNDSCDPTYLNYLYDLIDFHSRGLTSHHSIFPTALRNKVHLYQRCNLIVTRHLSIKIDAKKAILPPDNFFQYRKLLQESVKDINDNAMSGLRKRTYSSIATLSSGYDSTACAVLAKEIGCKQAVTLVTARQDKQWGDDMDDSGTKIAETLGLSITEYDRLEYEHNNFPEAEFCACGTGEDINLLAMEDSFVGKMVFTGARGDFVWERLGFSVPWNSIVSFGITEFRLRVGYIHMAPCSIGEEYHQIIEKISNSSEMNHWSIGDFYDRPIPRRIAEDAGIPRSYFGQQKKATSHNPIWGISGMSENSSIDYQKFAKSVHKRKTISQRAKFVLGNFLIRLNNRVNKIICAVAKGLGKKLEPRLILSHRYLRTPSMDDLTFHWGQDKIEFRYTQN